MSPVLVGWLQALFWIAGAAAAIYAVSAVLAYVAFEQVVDSGRASDLDAWTQADDAVTGLSAVFLAASIGLFVLLVIWTHQCHRAASRLNPGLRKWSSGWAVGAWFIPVANLLLPKLVIDETEKIVSAPRSWGQVVPAWRTIGKVDPLGWWWWAVFVGGNTFLRVVASTTVDIDRDPQSEIEAYYLLSALLLVVVATGAALGAFFVRRYSRRVSAASLLPI